ncbi:site-specific integrase [Ochrobactrum sp. C6C9]|uniref:tyrosine-type recombinase/integrase n=1 Tax=Ochrobactrum sp. C6C9 TaxID=2736662 RepID=UPI003530392F|nr:site-specific integrase [Ochrobactrum sp. C6C9]
MSEAEEALEEFLRNRRTKNAPKALNRVLVAEALLDYAKFKADKPARSQRIAYAMVHLLDFWQQATVSEINRETLKAYELQRKAARATVRRELTCLRAALNHSVAMNRMVPFPRLELPEDGKPRQRWLTKHEVAKLIRAARKEFRSRHWLVLFILVAVYTGARKTAILELEWSQIDFVNRMLDFNQPNAEETNKRRARIPLGPKLFGHLLRRHRRSNGPYVFHQKGDANTRIHSIDKGFRAACIRAGLKHVTPHTLRHTRASWFAQDGEKILDVSEYMAVSTETLAKVYTHHNPKHLRALAARL